MNLTLCLLENKPQAVAGQHWRSELLTRVRVADGALVRLGHGARPVGRITETWWADDDRLMARAHIDPAHEYAVREAVTDTRGASLEFSDEGDPELIPDGGPDGHACMRIKGARILGVAIGQHRPSRSDTRVVHIPAPPEPEREPVLSTRAAARFPLPEPGVMRYAGGGRVYSVR